MKDHLFIEKMEERGKAATEKLRIEFTGISIIQLNWKPAPESWSIGECIDHLLVSDCTYFPVLRKITEGKFEMNNWEKWSPFTTLLGNMLVNQTQEKVKKKLNAPKLFVPSSSEIDIGIFSRFQKHQDTLLEYIAGCKTFDLDRTNITSPASKFITYSLRDAITILIQHQHRHINQAIRVKNTKGFPY